MSDDVAATAYLAKEFKRVMFCPDKEEVVAVFQTTTKPSREVILTEKDIEAELDDASCGPRDAEECSEHYDARCNQMWGVQDSIKALKSELGLG